MDLKHILLTPESSVEAQVGGYVNIHTCEFFKIKAHSSGLCVLMSFLGSMQKKLGGDIIIPLDELLPFNVSDEEVHKSLLMTHRWEARSLITHLNDVRNLAMYAVLHGGTNLKYRQGKLAVNKTVLIICNMI